MPAIRIVAACFAAAAFTFGASSPALAHGEREAGGYAFVVGWADEPTYVGFPNAVELIVTRDGQPVEGLADALKVEVRLGEESIGPLDMRPVFGSAGEYRADLIPTAPGAYTFHFTGELPGHSLDLRMTAGEDAFDEVHTTEEVTFPEPAPANSELAEAVDRLAHRVERSADDDAAGTARLLGYVGIGLGVVALVVAGLALARRGTAA